MTKHAYEYTVDKDDYRYEFDSRFTPQSYWVFEDAGEDFYNNHDGWECKWPMRFDVYHNDKWLGAKEVHIDMVPSFTCFDILEAA